MPIRFVAGVAAVALLTVAIPHPAHAEEAESSSPPRTEWIVDGVLAAAWLAMLPTMFIDTNTEATIGPSFRGPEDVAALETALAGRRIDHPFSEEETVSDAELGYMLLGTTLGALVISYGLAPWIDGDPDQDGRWFGEQLLNATLGLVHAIFGTYMLTSVAKVASGRLRPDFADRADRYYCYQDPIPAPYQARCGGLEASGELGPEVGEEHVERGRRSFWSGHSSLSFAAATYASLLIGGRMVWGDSATAWTRTLGIMLQGGALAAAVFAAATRVTDGVHHLEDVLVGAAVGTAVACLGYFLHFDGSGEVRRGVSLSVAPTGEGVSLGAFGRF